MLSELYKGQIPLRYPARELVCDLLYKRVASELDNVMEFGLKPTTLHHSGLPYVDVNEAMHSG